MTAELRRDLETAHAQRDAALSALQALESLLTRIGGYMTPEDQDALRAARALLAETGRKASPRAAEWVDR